MYYVYLDKLLLPVAPSKIEVKINNQNKTYTLINGNEINVLKEAKLTDITFDIMIPSVKYPFATYKNGFCEATYYLEWLERLKNGRESFSFKITRAFPNGEMLFDTEMMVSLEDYKITDDATNGFDVMVSVSLKQYKDFGLKTIQSKKTILKKNAKILSVKKIRPTKNSPAPKEKAKMYTVKKGDCLWKIAKKFYGDGSKYKKIYIANRDKIENANRIAIGQILTIPCKEENGY